MKNLIKKFKKKLELNLNNIRYFNVNHIYNNNDKYNNYDKYIKNQIPILAIQYDDIYINIISTGNINIIFNFTSSMVNQNISEYMRNAEYTYETNLNKYGKEEKKK